jgi:hypothetical protein
MRAARDMTINLSVPNAIEKHCAREWSIVRQIDASGA